MIRKVIVFYALTFLITLVLGGIQEAAVIPSETLTLPQLAPGASALLMLILFRKDGHVISFAVKVTPFSRYAMAVLIPLGGALVAYLINAQVLSSLSLSGTQAAPWTLLLWIPIGAIGEELGWRGYLHKRIHRNLNGLLSSIVVGTLWALWHVGLYQNGSLYMLFFILLMVSYSLLIFALVHDIAFSVAIAAIFHVMINLTNLFSYSVINEISFIATNSLAWAAVAGVVLVSRKHWFIRTASNT
jgi:membrane protease YdiL (CAAX protease family)